MHGGCVTDDDGFTHARRSSISVAPPLCGPLRVRRPTVITSPPCHAAVGGFRQSPRCQLQKVCLSVEAKLCSTFLLDTSVARSRSRSILNRKPCETNVERTGKSVRNKNTNAFLSPSLLRPAMPTVFLASSTEPVYTSWSFVETCGPCVRCKITSVSNARCGLSVLFFFAKLGGEVCLRPRSINEQLLGLHLAPSLTPEWCRCGTASSASTSSRTVAWLLPVSSHTGWAS